MLAYAGATDPCRYALSYLVEIKAFIVALMQYTAEAQDSCSAQTLEAQPWTANGITPCSIEFHLLYLSTAAGHSQLQLCDWHPDLFSDVPPIIRPTIYKQNCFYQYDYDYSELYTKQVATAIAGRPWYDPTSHTRLVSILCRQRWQILVFHCMTHTHTHTHI